MKLTRVAAFNGKIATLNEPLAGYRVHDKYLVGKIKGEFKDDLKEQLYNYVNSTIIKDKEKWINYDTFLKLKKVSPFLLIFYIRKAINSFVS